MNTLTLYKNSKPYPYYSNSLTTVKTLNVTPFNQNLRSGYIDIELTGDEMFTFNYLSYKRGSKLIYGWVTDIEKLSRVNLYRVNFEVDPLRTYRNNLILGKQIIERRPQATKLHDPYLGSSNHHNDMIITKKMIGDPTSRFAVVQKRQPGAAEVCSRVPGIPTPYQFWVCKYLVNDWTSSKPLRQLLNKFVDSGQTSDIVTIYSVPFVDSQYLTGGSLNFKVGNENKAVEGWSLIGELVDPKGKFQNIMTLDFKTNYPDITKSQHSMNIVIPDAGVLNVPDEIAFGDRPVLVRDVDIFSGSCNYHLALENGLKMTPFSVRGSALSTIPILSNPYDTYISQNQNTLAASLLGDTASLVIGGGMLASGNPLGAGMAMSGGSSAFSTLNSLSDAKNMIPSNPPAFLGSALVSDHNNWVYQVVTKKPYTNEAEVRDRLGYPYNVLDTLVIPSNGFIQTSNCSVSSDGSVPLWAINEVNQLFDNGIKFE